MNPTSRVLLGTTILALCVTACSNIKSRTVNMSELADGALTECNLKETDLRGITATHVKTIQAIMMFGKDVGKLNIEDFQEELVNFKSLKESRSALRRYHYVSVEPSKDCTIRKITSIYDKATSVASPHQYALRFELK